MLDATETAIVQGENAPGAVKPVSAPKGGPWLGSLKKLLRRPVFDLALLILFVVVLMALFPGLFTSIDPQDCSLRMSRLGSSSGHLMGYDAMGCDYYSNIVHGARTSLQVGVLTAVFTFLIALITGCLAGFYGGIVDMVISRIADVFLGMPVLVASIVVLYQFKSRNVWTIVFVLVLFGWAGTMRYMRGSVIQIKDREYVDAARVLGVSNWTILRRHVLPNAITPLIVMTTLGIGAGMTAEAGFAILGVGLKLPAFSWGLQIQAASTDGNWQLAPHLMFFPALMLGMTTLAFVVIGESLREVLDPRGR